MPTDTMIPVTPASVSASPLRAERKQMIEYMRAGPHAEAEDHDHAEAPVVDEHVQGDGGEADDPGDRPASSESRPRVADTCCSALRSNSTGRAP